MGVWGCGGVGVWGCGGVGVWGCGGVGVCVGCGGGGGGCGGVGVWGCGGVGVWGCGGVGVWGVGVGAGAGAGARACVRACVHACVPCEGWHSRTVFPRIAPHVLRQYDMAACNQVIAPAMVMGTAKQQEEACADEEPEESENVLVLGLRTSCRNISP